MRRLKEFLGISGPREEARQRALAPTGLSAREWILASNAAPLEVTEAGNFPTLEGKAAIIDPLCLIKPQEWIDVPKDGGQVTVFFDPEQGRNSKLALIFSSAEVAGGDDVSTCMVDAGMASIFTPETYRATDAFRDGLGETGNIYDDYFERFDEPSGGERKMAHLPDGTPVPYVHSGWGDGAYPVFTLLGPSREVVAIYTDFLGCNENGDYLTPPGFVIEGGGK